MSTSMSNSIGPVTANPFITSIIPTMYVRDLDQAIVWYCEALHFKVLAYNPHFATMEMAPGRICWINKNAEKAGTGRTNLHVKDTAGLYKHLVELGTDADPLDLEAVANTHWFTFRDPDGNEFGVWTGLFGVNDLEMIPAPSIDKLAKYTYVERPDIHVIGLQVTVDITSPEPDLVNAAAELEQQLAELPGILSETFYVNPILPVYEDVESQTLFACNEVAAPLSNPPANLVAFTIPAHRYAVFSFDRTRTDFRKEYTFKYRWLGRQFGFLKIDPGQPNAYHLEVVHEDRIEVFIPYQLGPDITHDYR